MTRGARPVRAPRGTGLSCLSWQQKAVLRMIMSNLDPAVAERRDDLVAYRSSKRAARSWDPGLGVVRHVDAGYERAIEVARERDKAIPMLGV